MGKSMRFDADGQQLNGSPLRTRIAVFKGLKTNPSYHLKPKAAVELVRDGLAKYIGPNAIRLISVEPVAKSAHQVAGSQRQGRVYLSAAADPNRRYLQGGLQRTEHNPPKFDPWMGAKVGHQ